MSLSLEKLNNDRLVVLHRIAEDAEDTALQDSIEGELLEDFHPGGERACAQLRMGNKLMLSREP